MQNNKNERSISKISDRHFIGKDEQADNKAIIIAARLGLNMIHFC